MELVWETNYQYFFNIEDSISPNEEKERSCQGFSLGGRLYSLVLLVVKKNLRFKDFKVGFVGSTFTQGESSFAHLHFCTLAHFPHLQIAK
jgi:hypothetical protein